MKFPKQSNLIAIKKIVKENLATHCKHNKLEKTIDNSKKVQQKIILFEQIYLKTLCKRTKLQNYIDENNYSLSVIVQALKILKYQTELNNTLHE